MVSLFFYFEVFPLFFILPGNPKLLFLSLSLSCGINCFGFSFFFPIPFFLFPLFFPILTGNSKCSFLSLSLSCGPGNPKLSFLFLSLYCGIKGFGFSFFFPVTFPLFPLFFLLPGNLKFAFLSYFSCGIKCFVAPLSLCFLFSFLFSTSKYFRFFLLPGNPKCAFLSLSFLRHQELVPFSLSALFLAAVQYPLVLKKKTRCRGWLYKSKS